MYAYADKNGKLSESTRRTGLRQDRHNTKNVQLLRENIHFTFFARFDLINALKVRCSHRTAGLMITSL